MLNHKPVLLTPDQVTNQWPTLLPMIVAVKENSVGKWQPEDVLCLVQQNHDYHIAIIQDDINNEAAITGLIGFVVSETPFEKLLNFHLFHHDNPDVDGRIYVDWVLDIARQYQCDAVTAIAKRPYHRYRKDFYIESHNFRCDL